MQTGKWKTQGRAKHKFPTEKDKEKEITVTERDSIADELTSRQGRAEQPLNLRTSLEIPILKDKEHKDSTT